MTQVDTNHPTKVGSLFTIGAGVMALVGIGAYSMTGLAVAVLGLAVVVIGLLLPRPGLLTIGALGIFIGAVLAGIDEAPVGAVLVGTIGAILAWDIGHNAASHGRQVGATTNTTSTEALHAAGSFGAGIFTAAIAYGGYTVATGGQPALAIGILLFAAIAAVWAFR